jgi:hypothetical protein
MRIPTDTPKGRDTPKDTRHTLTNALVKIENSEVKGATGTVRA